MKNFKTLRNVTLIMCLVSSMAFSQTFKVTGGVNLMSVKTAFELGDIASPTDGDPTDNPTDDEVPAKMVSSKKSTTQLGENNFAFAASNKSTINETGFYLGVALSDVSLSDNIELQPEIRFVAVKDFNQIQVPVLAKYNLSEKFNAFAGPNFQFLLDTGETTKSFNFAVDFGVSYNVSDKIALDARYDWGQTNLLKNGDSNNYLKINNIQLGIAYQFGN